MDYKKIEVSMSGWMIQENMVYDNAIWHRVDSSEDGIDWFPEGYAGVNEFNLRKTDEKLNDELENVYIKSKKGYNNLFKK